MQQAPALMVKQAPPSTRTCALLTVTAQAGRLDPVTMTTVSRDERAAVPAARGDRRLPWLARAFVVAGLGMIPWLVLLATQLPASTVAAHWSTAWVGLDAMETVGLLATGTLLLRRDHRCCLAATVTGTLVFTDAWFDVATAAPGAAQLTAIVMAAVIEVPVSVLCAALAIYLMPANGPGPRG